MKEKIYAIENIIGRLFHALYEGDDERIVHLFAENSQLKQLDAKVCLSGKEEIGEFWKHQIENGVNADGVPQAVYLPCDIYLEEKGEILYYGEWDTYSFRSEEKERIQYFLTHMQAQFIYEDYEWKIQKLIWNEILELVPWRFNDKRRMPVTAHVPWLEGVKDSLSLQDYMEIRNLQGHFTHQGMDRRAEWFSRSEDVRLRLPSLSDRVMKGNAEIEAFLKLLKDKEIENGKNYMFLPVITAPLIYGDETRARGLWLVFAVEVKAGAFGISAPPYKIVMNVGRFVQEFVKENGKWRFFSFNHEIAFYIDAMDYDPQNTMRHRMREGDLWENTWLTGPEASDVRCPEDVHQIEMIMPQWTGRIRKGNSIDFVDTYMVNSRKEISMMVAGSTLKRTCGYEEICRRFGPREKTGRRENPAFHTLATPVIEFYEDGKYAKAVWTDFSMADFSGAFHFPLKPTCYHMTVSKYYHEFVREGDAWKLFAFGWEPGIFLGGFPFAEEKCRGFYKGWNNTKSEFPMIGEAYIYPEEK